MRPSGIRPGWISSPSSQAARKKVALLDVDLTIASCADNLYNDELLGNVSAMGYKDVYFFTTMTVDMEGQNHEMGGGFNS